MFVFDVIVCFLGYEFELKFFIEYFCGFGNVYVGVLVVVC